MSGEAIVLKKTLTVLQKHDKVYAIRMSNTATGIPDIIACIGGRFVGIEVKDDVGGTYTLTEAQKVRAKQILQSGGDFWIVDKHNVDYLNDTIDSYLERSVAR